MKGAKATRPLLRAMSPASRSGLLASKACPMCRGVYLVAVALVSTVTTACQLSTVGQSNAHSQNANESRTRTANVGPYQEQWTERFYPELGWVRHGTFVVVSIENGVKVEELSYRFGVLEGPYRSWNDDSGRLIAHGHFKKGLRTGMCFRYWESGGKESEGYYEDDEPIGLHRTWFRNGQLHSEGSYALNRLNDGNQIGWWRFWHENGQLSHEGTFSADAGGRRGIWQGWHLNGKLAWRGEYDKVPGVFPSYAKQGPWQYWHPNGQLAATGIFTIGTRTGEWAFWDSAGHSVSEVEYLRRYARGAIYIDEQ